MKYDKHLSNIHNTSFRIVFPDYIQSTPRRGYCCLSLCFSVLAALNWQSQSRSSLSDFKILCLLFTRGIWIRFSAGCSWKFGAMQKENAPYVPFRATRLVSIPFIQTMAASLMCLLHLLICFTTCNNQAGVCLTCTLLTTNFVRGVEIPSCNFNQNLFMNQCTSF